MATCQISTVKRYPVGGTCGKEPFVGNWMHRSFEGSGRPVQRFPSAFLEYLGSSAHTMILPVLKSAHRRMHGLVTIHASQIRKILISQFVGRPCPPTWLKHETGSGIL